MELGRGCGSTAWCYAVWDIHNWMVGHWPLSTQEEYFASGPDTLSSSSFATAGKLEPVEGGFRLSGRWEFSSGSDAATWALLGAMGSSARSLRLCLVRTTRSWRTHARLRPARHRKQGRHR
jgi:3-hydroxy-9,10-secoandrosta-1,3,5(10)-triene-9,17-dione monooxygenase